MKNCSVAATADYSVAIRKEKIPQALNHMLRILLLIVFTAATVFSSSSSTHDTNGDGWVTVLVPIAFSGDQFVLGAHGSRWTGELWVHNASADGLQGLQPFDCTLQGGCPFALPKGFAGVFPSLLSNDYDRGALLNIPAAVASEIHLSARMLELSRRVQAMGVTIPVVREDDFFTAPTEYLSVPVTPAVRAALRVYDPRFRRGSAVRVEFLSPDGSVVAETTLRPGDHPNVPDQPLFNPVSNPYPGVAAIHNITDVLPQLREYSHFHVRVTPLTPGMEYWAMVSVTDNETQYVLLITAD